MTDDAFIALFRPGVSLQVEFRGERYPGGAVNNRMLILIARGSGVQDEYIYRNPKQARKLFDRLSKLTLKSPPPEPPPPELPRRSLIRLPAKGFL